MHLACQWAAEALACDTLVIALRDGSVPEVIEHGVTGDICSSEEEMVAAIKRLGEIHRGHCRAEAERRFSPVAMARASERLYKYRVVIAAWPPSANSLDCGPPTPEAQQCL